MLYFPLFKDIPGNLRAIKYFQNKSTVTIWGAVSNNGKLPLKFIDKEVKINAEFYKQDILAIYVLPYTDRLHPKKNWIYQHDSAPSHRAKSAQNYLHVYCPKFIRQEDWLPSSQDLIPLDYCIWGILEAKGNAKYRSLDSLKASVLLKWDKLCLKVICATIGQWGNRLSLVIDKDGCQFE